jgi:hypothetical protein
MRAFNKLKKIWSGQFRDRWVTLHNRCNNTFGSLDSVDFRSHGIQQTKTSSSVNIDLFQSRLSTNNLAQMKRCPNCGTENTPDSFSATHAENLCNKLTLKIESLVSQHSLVNFPSIKSYILVGSPFLLKL